MGVDEVDDAGPALRRADDAADGRAAGGGEGAGHDLVRGDHELFDEGAGAVVGGGGESLNVAVDEDGVSFGAVELEGAGFDAGGVEELGGGVLEAELGLEVGGGGDLVVGGAGALEPWADLAVGELGLVANGGFEDGGVGDVAGGGDGEAEDEGGAVGGGVERGEASGKLGGEHGEVAGGGVDGLALGRCVEVERGALGDGGGDVGDRDGDLRTGWKLGGELDLVEVAGGVVVDRGPERGAEIGGCGWGGGGCDGGELREGIGREIGVEAGGEQVVEGGGGKVERGCRGHGV